MAKLLTAASVAALTMALLGYAGSGQLGNFGDVGIDQGTFGVAVFLWFAVVGAITVAMAGGVRYRPRKPKAAASLRPSRSLNSPTTISRQPPIRRFLSPNVRLSPASGRYPHLEAKTAPHRRRTKPIRLALCSNRSACRPAHRHDW